MNVRRGFQSKVENIVTEPSSHPLARTFPSGENSKAEIVSFSPAMVVSRSYRRADMGALDDDKPRDTTRAIAE
jgi:hypothetical protein